MVHKQHNTEALTHHFFVPLDFLKQALHNSLLLYEQESTKDVQMISNYLLFAFDIIYRYILSLLFKTAKPKFHKQSLTRIYGCSNPPIKFYCVQSSSQQLIQIRKPPALIFIHINENMKLRIQAIFLRLLTTLCVQKVGIYILDH